MSLVIFVVVAPLITRNLMYNIIPAKASSSDPVNRVMTVWAGPDSPTPDIACMVGFTSIEITQLWRANCSSATRHRLAIPEVDRKKLKWPKEKTEIVSVLFLSLCQDNPERMLQVRIPAG